MCLFLVSLSRSFSFFPRSVVACHGMGENSHDVQSSITWSCLRDCDTRWLGRRWQTCMPFFYAEGPWMTETRRRLFLFACCCLLSTCDLLPLPSCLPIVFVPPCHEQRLHLTQMSDKTRMMMVNYIQHVFADKDLLSSAAAFLHALRDGCSFLYCCEYDPVFSENVFEPTKYCTYLFGCHLNHSSLLWETVTRILEEQHTFSLLRRQLCITTKGREFHFAITSGRGAEQKEGIRETRGKCSRVIVKRESQVLRQVKDHTVWEFWGEMCVYRSGCFR